MQRDYSEFNIGRLIYGRGSIAFLRQYSGKNVAVIYDSNVLDEAKQESLKELIGGDLRFIADISAEPAFSDIQKALEELGDFEPDLFVAIGGGSVMDMTKAVWLYHDHPGLAFEDAFKPFQLPKPTGKSSIVAIPTTSGTGSETTCAAVFTNDETQEKHLILGFEIVPEVAILDPDFTDTLPKTIAAHTGMDALSHAIEAAVCIVASPIVISTALGATIDILQNLPISVNEDDSEKRGKARELVHYAATMAGVAINNSSAGLAHALDQAGPYFNIPHGLICGLTLPYTTAFHSPHPVYAELATRLGLGGADDSEKCQALVDYLWDFNTEVGIVHSYSELGVDEKEFFEKISDFAAIVEHSMAARLSPRQPSVEEAEEILRAAYYGEKPEVK